MTDKIGLQGLRVISFESRFSDTMGSLIRAQGGEVFLAPSMKEVPLENNAAVFEFADRLFAGKIDAIILLTGAGAKVLLTVLETRFEKEKILDILRKTVIIPRGPKPIRVLRDIAVPFALTVPEPNTWKELLAEIDAHPDIFSPAGKTVAVQEYGVPNDDLVFALQARRAQVFRVPVYRWTLPDDLEPLRQAVRMILEGKAQVAMFTTAVQIEHLLRVAGDMTPRDQFLDALNRLAVASVGPDCSEAMKARGVRVDIQPESPKMGPLVVATAQMAGKVLEQKRI